MRAPQPGRGEDVGLVDADVPAPGRGRRRSRRPARAPRAPVRAADRISSMAARGAVALGALVLLDVGAVGDVADDRHVGGCRDPDGAHADPQVEHVPQPDQRRLRVRASADGHTGVGADRADEDDVGLSARVDRLGGQHSTGLPPSGAAVRHGPGEGDRRAVGGQPLRRKATGPSRISAPMPSPGRSAIVVMGAAAFVRWWSVMECARVGADSLLEFVQPARDGGGGAPGSGRVPGRRRTPAARAGSRRAGSGWSGRRGPSRSGRMPELQVRAEPAQSGGWPRRASRRNGIFGWLTSSRWTPRRRPR